MNEVELYEYLDPELIDLGDYFLQQLNENPDQFNFKVEYQPRLTLVGQSINLDAHIDLSHQVIEASTGKFCFNVEVQDAPFYFSDGKRVLLNGKRVLLNVDTVRELVKRYAPELLK